MSWKVNLQHVVASSSMEVEYIAMIEVVKETLWIEGMLNKLGMRQEVLTVHCDNKSAMHLTKNQMFHEKTKHIDVRMNFVKNILTKGEIQVVKIHIEDNLVDMLTKPVIVAKFKLAWIWSKSKTCEVPLRRWSVAILVQLDSKPRWRIVSYGYNSIMKK